MNEKEAEESDKLKYRSKPFPIVAIGASAGGLAAVSELLQHLPADTGMAYVYIQHLDPDHKSSLTAILQRVTQMKVVEADNLMPIEADQLFIIPPNKTMSILDGVFKLVERAPRPEKHSPIDYFFSSLAQKQKEGSIGIVLSGTASDGTAGLRKIKMVGGLTYAQDDSAQFQSMPRSAIAENAADTVMSPKELAGELERLSKQKLLLKTLFIPALSDDEQDERESEKEEAEAADGENINPEDYQIILKLLNETTGVDFSHYKKNTIRRRIIRRMILNKFDKIDDYIQYLKKRPFECEQLYQDFLINVTNFFRDPETIAHLKNEVLPSLLKSKTTGNPLRIWVPACSTGEEAYSLAMLLMELNGEGNGNAVTQIFATDLSETAISKARTGIYNIGDVAQLPKNYLDKYFQKTDGHYRIVKRIRDLCVFAPHNIFKDPPFSRVDMVSCCNLLIYLDMVLQKKVLYNFHYALNKTGYLVLGKSETVGTATNLFTHVDKKAKVYLKKSDVAPKAIFDINYRLPEIERIEPQRSKKTLIHREASADMNVEKVVDNILLSKYVPAGVIVNYDLDIIQFRGSTGLFLEPLPGKASLNLLKMARPGLELELRNATHKAIKTEEPVKISGLDINYKGNIHHISFEVTLLKELAKEDLLLIIFEEVKTPSPASLKASFSKDRRVKQLEAELVALREDMRSIVEEQEAANEELQSANEEIVSSNEELQSINEELETSKEELESSNEELMTINQELQVRNDQLAEAHDYTEAIIATIREAAIVLDSGLRLKSANKAFYRTFQAKEEEVEGKLIYEFNNFQWDIPKLREFLEKILPENSQFSGYEITHKFDGIGEKVLLLNGRHVTQKTSRQQFILLAMEDITEHRQAERLLEEREAWLRKMSDNVPVMIWVSGPDKNFTFLNKSWLAFTGRTLSKETGIGWTEGVYKNDLELVLSTYHASFEVKEPFTIEYRMKRHDGEYRWILNSGVPTFDASGEFTGYTGSCIEMHDKRLMKEELEKQVSERTLELQNVNANLERSNSELAQFAYVASHDLQEPLRKVITFSNRIKERYIDSFPDAGKELVEKISRSSERMRSLIDDLLNFSRINRSDKKVVNTDLNNVLKTVLSDFDLLIQEKSAVVHSEKLPVLEAVPLYMSQLFHNLVGNALKFVSPGIGPVITISCRMLPGEEVMNFGRLISATQYHEIAFKDNGIGFPQEFSEQIFVIFQRLNGKEDFPGTGIGLALCRKIVNNHNGHIYAESEENKGSVFHVILPAKQPETSEVNNVV